MLFHSHLENAVYTCLFPPQAEIAVVDVGETLVGSYRSIEIPLVNNSPCSVSFCLSVQQRLLEDELIYDPETEPSGIFFLVDLWLFYVCEIHRFSMMSI